MGDLRWDIEKAVFNSTMDSRARLIMLALLAKADNATAVTAPDYTPAFSTLAAMTGLSKAVLSEWLQALEDSGWVTRSKPDGGGRGNRTIYTMREGASPVVRRSRDRRVPRPRKNGSPSEPFDDETVRPANASGVRNGSLGERFSEEKGFAQRTQNSSPSEPFSPVKGSPGERATTLRTTKNHQPARGADGDPQTGPAAHSPSVRSWEADNRQPRTVGGRVPRQPSLFDVRRAEIEKLPEATRIIGGWLQANGYPNVSGTDCAAVHQAVIRQHSGVRDMLGYLRRIATGGGFYQYYRPIIEARADEIGEQISHLQETEPACEHGTSAGRSLHPTTGLMLCPGCRDGLPPTIEKVDETTHPDVESAINTYRAALGRHDLFALLAFGAEASALHRRGVQHADLIRLARTAAATGRGLLETASSTIGAAA